jgi:hypothetical protein
MSLFTNKSISCLRPIFSLFSPASLRLTHSNALRAHGVKEKKLYDHVLFFPHYYFYCYSSYCAPRFFPAMCEGESACKRRTRKSCWKIIPHSNAARHNVHNAHTPHFCAMFNLYGVKKTSRKSLILIVFTLSRGVRGIKNFHIILNLTEINERLSVVLWSW